MDEDIEGGEDQDSDEEAARAKGRKGKGKGKAKASEVEPKPKKKAAPRARGKGKAKEVGGVEAKPKPKPKPKPALAPEHVAAEAIGEASDSAPGVPAGPASSTEPIMVAELEAMLPQFSEEAFGIMDEMDPDEDAEVEALKLSQWPNLVRYIELELYRTGLELNALKRLDRDDFDEGIEAIGERSQALREQLRRLNAAGENAQQETPSVSVHDDGDVEMRLGDDAGE